MRQLQGTGISLAVKWGPGPQKDSPSVSLAVLRLMSLGVFIAAIGMPLLVLRFSGEAQTWQGYYMVASDWRLEDSDWLQLAFPGSVTSKFPVTFTVFDGFESQPSDLITERLDSLDPRFDLFMRTVPGYFTAKDMFGSDRSLVYLATELPPALFLLRLAFSSPQAVLGVLDFDVRRRLLFAALVIIVVVCSLFARLSRCRFPDGVRLAFAAAPWIVAVLNVGGPAAIAAATVIPAVGHMREGTLVRIATSAILFSAVITTAGIVIGGAFVGISLASATIGSVTSIGLDCRSSSSRLRVGSARSKRPVVVIGLGFIFVAAVTVTSVGSFLPNVAVPTPDTVAKPLSFDGLSQLGPQALDDLSLPNAADYVAHIAFQEGLTFGMSYRLPLEGERLTLKTYHFDTENRRVQQSERIVLTFDRRWLKRVIVDARGVGRLLLSRGNAVAVYRQSISNVVYQRWHIRQTLLLALFSGAAALVVIGWVFRDRAIG